MDTIVLLNVLLMCAWPCETFFFSLRRGFRANRSPPSSAEASWRTQLPAGLKRGFAEAPRHAAPVTSSGLLLPGDRALRALAGTRVGLGALAAHGKATAVPQTLVATDLDLAADVAATSRRRSPSTLKFASM
jgi:hypothetical protein